MPSFLILAEFDGGGQLVKRVFSCSFSLSRGVFVGFSLNLAIYSLHLFSLLFSL